MSAIIRPYFNPCNPAFGILGTKKKAPPAGGLSSASGLAFRDLAGSQGKRAAWALESGCELLQPRLQPSHVHLRSPIRHLLPDAVDVNLDVRVSGELVAGVLVPPLDVLLHLLRRAAGVGHEGLHQDALAGEVAADAGLRPIACLDAGVQLIRGHCPVVEVLGLLPCQLIPVLLQPTMLDVEKTKRGVDWIGAGSAVVEVEPKGDIAGGGLRQLLG